MRADTAVANATRSLTNAEMRDDRDAVLDAVLLEAVHADSLLCVRWLPVRLGRRLLVVLVEVLLLSTDSANVACGDGAITGS